MKDNKYTILIANESAIDTAVLKAGIITKERTVECVCSGKDVLAYVQLNRPDLILLDVMLSDIDGYEVCRQLKQNYLTKDIPIIFHTALTDTNAVAQGLELGAIDYIVKPYNLVEVNARIKNHLILYKGHERSIELLKGFANAVSDVVLMSDTQGEILEVFGNYNKYFPQITNKGIKQQLSDVLPKFLYKQFMIAMETVCRTQESFEFETESLVETRKNILQITMDIVICSAVISIKILDITDRCLSERKVDLTYEYQKRSRFFNSILTGGYSEEQQNQLLNVYGIENQKPLVCYVISTVLLGDGVLNIANLRASVGEWLIEKGHGWIWNSNFGIGMLMQYPSNLAEIEKVAILLRESLAMRFPNIAINIGAANTEISKGDFKQLYYDALAALMMAIDEKREYVVATSGNTGLHEVLVHTMEHMDIDRFIDQVLGKVQQSDLKNGSDLLGTLEQLIRMPSVKLVAANLFIHPNTVLWRKQKIEEILETSLDSIDTRTKINLALKFMHIRKFIKTPEGVVISL